MKKNSKKKAEKGIEEKKQQRGKKIGSRFLTNITLKRKGTENKRFSGNTKGTMGGWGGLLRKNNEPGSETGPAAPGTLPREHAGVGRNTVIRYSAMQRHCRHLSIGKTVIQRRVTTNEPKPEGNNSFVNYHGKQDAILACLGPRTQAAEGT